VWELSASLRGYFMPLSDLLDPLWKIYEKARDDAVKMGRKFKNFLQPPSTKIFESESFYGRLHGPEGAFIISLKVQFINTNKEDEEFLTSFTLRCKGEWYDPRKYSGTELLISSGRRGYTFKYNGEKYLTNPIKIPKDSFSEYYVLFFPLKLQEWPKKPKLAVLPIFAHHRKFFMKEGFELTEISDESMLPS
jgi:hypothetical protein